MKIGDPISPSGFVRLASTGRHGTIVRQARGLCTWCGRKVPKGRTTWCSKTCVSRFHMTQPGVLRDLVLERDRGVCALCACDTYRFRRAIVAYEKGHTVAKTAALLTHLGKPTAPDVVGHLTGDRRTVWDMDHIVPVAKQGDLFSLDNLRTLCYWCHKDVTREQTKKYRSGPCTPRS